MIVHKSLSAISSMRHVSFLRGSIGFLLFEENVRKWSVCNPIGYYVNVSGTRKVGWKGESGWMSKCVNYNAIKGDKWILMRMESVK